MERRKVNVTTLPFLHIKTPNLGDSAITGQYEQVVETRWVWKNVPVYDEHDGMVGNHSSQIPTYQAPLLIRNIEVKGVNHMEMSGHPRMRETTARLTEGLPISAVLLHRRWICCTFVPQKLRLKLAIWRQY